jgi:hypothetical protein
MGIIIGIVAVAVILIGVLAWFYCRRRRMRAATMAGNSTDTDSKGIERSDETKDSGIDSGKDHGSLGAMEEGNMSEAFSAPKCIVPPAVISTMPIKDDHSSVADKEEYPRPTPSRKPSARDKKKAIEEWNMMKKQGSNRSLESFVSGQSSVDDDERPRRRSSRTRSASKERSSSRERLDTGLSGQNLPKKISSRDLSRLLKENTENAEKLRDVEAERNVVEEQLYKAEDEAEKLRIEKEETLRRLEELEAQNKLLKRELKSGGSTHSRSRSKSRERSSKRKSSSRSRERRPRSRSTSRRSKSKERSSS